MLCGAGEGGEIATGITAEMSSATRCLGLVSVTAPGNPGEGL